MLRHLAVFPGGFAFEAAQAVGGDGRADHSIVEDLFSLVSKSLCERVNGASPTRWRLLETIRAYALEKLTEAGEYPAAARRHAEHFRDLIVPIAAESTTWLSHDDLAPGMRELDNVRAALDWAFSPEGDAEIGVRLTAAFAPVWQMLSLMGECRERVERMLAIRPPDTRLSRATELRMWIAYSESLTMTFSSIERTRRAIETAMDLAADVDDVDLQAGLLYGRWSIDFMSGDQGAALSAARQLAAVTPRGGDSMKLVGERILGASLLCAGALADAQECLQRVLDFYVAPSDGYHPLLFRRDPRVLARVRLARVLGLRGHLDRAIEEARASFEAAQASGAGITVCWAVHDALCPIALMTGDLAAADAAVAAMDDWATRLDAALWKMMATAWKGKLLIERGDPAPGIELISQTLAACAQTGWRMGDAPFLGYLAEGLAALGRLEAAHATLERALAWATDKREDWYRPELLRLQGELLLLESNGARATEAEACFRAAAEVARQQTALFWELRIALSLAGLRIAQGRHDDIRPLLTTVYGRFTEGFETQALRDARALLDAQGR
jgi:predicted ATPase